MDEGGLIGFPGGHLCSVFGPFVVTSQPSDPQAENLNFGVFSIRFVIWITS